MVQVMSYDDARDLIQDGDIVFVAKKNSIMSSIIEFVTKSHFSHCFIVFWVEVAGQKRLMCVESQGGTTRRVLNLSYYKNLDLYVVTPTKPWPTVADVALAKLGKEDYGYLEVAYVGLREFLLTRFNIKLPYLSVGKGQICSEFVASVFDLPEKLVSPQLLFDELMRTQEVRIQIKNAA